MNFNFVETHVFTKLDISLNIYFSFASLVDFLGLEINVWKFWLKIPLTLCTKHWGLVAPPKLFSIFFHILRVWFYYRNEKNEGVSRRIIPFLFLVNHPSEDCTWELDPRYLKECTGQFTNSVHVSNLWILVQAWAHKPVPYYDMPQALYCDHFDQWFETKKVWSSWLDNGHNLTCTLSVSHVFIFMLRPLGLEIAGAKEQIWACWVEKFSWFSNKFVHKKWIKSNFLAISSKIAPGSRILITSPDLQTTVYITDIETEIPKFQYRPRKFFPGMGSNLGVFGILPRKDAGNAQCILRVR